MKIDGYMERNLKLQYPIIMDGEKYEEIVIREFGGIDELEVNNQKEKRKELKDDTTALLSLAITRCIAEVVGAKRLPTEKEISMLPYGEIERISVALRELTMGDEFRTLGSCPECGKTVELTVSSSDFLINTQLEYLTIEIPLRTGINKNGRQLKNAKIRPFNAQSMSCLSKILNDTELQTDKNNNLIFTLIESIDDTPVTMEDIKYLTKKDRQAIMDTIKIPKVIKPSLEYTCPYCNTDFDVGVWVFDFLY
jgi:hypothetical protein